MQSFKQIKSYSILFCLLSGSFLFLHGCVNRSITANQSIKEQYQSVCARCHDSGINQAPIAFSDRTWSDRLEKGIDILVDHVEQGYNKMPPGSLLCNNCTRDDFKALVIYMSKPQ